MIDRSKDSDWEVDSKTCSEAWSTGRSESMVGDDKCDDFDSKEGSACLLEGSCSIPDTDSTKEFSTEFSKLYFDSSSASLELGSKLLDVGVKFEISEMSLLTSILGSGIIGSSSSPT